MIIGEKLFDITTSVQAPGFSATEYWKVHQRAAMRSRLVGLLFTIPT